MLQRLKKQRQTKLSVFSCVYYLNSKFKRTGEVDKLKLLKLLKTVFLKGVENFLLKYLASKIISIIIAKQISVNK
jgi:hypothetical protein